MIAVSESRLKKGKHIANGMRCKLRKALLIYKLKQLESAFVELVNNNGRNIITGCIRKYPTPNNQ